MSKINLLSSKIYNRIAAGEVVERPFSVVKELVENSIDAGADNVLIEIEGGGIASIKITDNGSGIEKSQLDKALMPHATSKISTISDLDNITTLGFRGEALASIASVSKISITSKPSSQEFGANIYAEGGEIVGEVSDCAAVNGTVIKVDNLFFNTPVREKFLHSARSEEGEISSTVARFILGNPNVSFKYVADGKTIYQSFGDGIESAMVCVYGVEAVNNSFYIDTVKNGILIKGYAGKHHYTKGNRTHQTLFINGRYVQNQTISSAIMNAYSAYLMKRQYPFYVISLSLPTEIVDVNVHPNKLEVRFTNNQIIYGSIYSVMSKVLDGTSEALNIVSDDNKQSAQIPTSQITPSQEETIIKEYKQLVKPQPVNDKIVFMDSGNARSLETPKDFDVQNKKDSNTVDIFAENKAFLESLERKKQEREALEQQAIKVDRDLTLIGQALNTFLVLEDGKDLYFIDQHAAHERILFDKFNDSLKNNDVVKQPLLFPFTLNVNNAEFDFLNSKREVLSNMGIEIEEFGRNTFKVSAVPAFLSDMNLQSFFNEILSEMETLKNFTLNDLIVEKIAQKACKAAIKSGDKLSDLELKTLLDVLKENLGLKCPHGRPVAVKITRLEIDKWFKRII